MKLEQQVCRLGLAKRLKELGVKQDAFLVWDEDEERICRRELYEHHNYYSAFSVAELGEMLPRDCRLRRSVNEPGKWLVDALSTDRFFRAETEADARAKMLIYLLENKLLNP